MLKQNAPLVEAQFVNQVEHCYEELRRLIVTCEFPPGARLNEKALIERLGAGRTPVREALLRLNQDGLLEIKQRSGYIVRPLDRKSIEDILLAWGGVVPIIVEAANRNMTAANRADLLDQLTQLRQLANHDPLQSSLFSGQGMGKLVKIADCEPLTFIYRHIAANLERISRLLHFVPHEERWADSLEFTADIVREEDAVKAAATARDRVARSSRELLKFLDTQPDYIRQELPYLTDTDRAAAVATKAQRNSAKRKT